MAEPRTDELTDAEHAIRERVEAKLGDPPERWKAIEDYTPADHEARHRGERIESEEYRDTSAKFVVRPVWRTTPRRRPLRT